MHLWSKRKAMQLEKLVKHKIEPSRKNHIPPPSPIISIKTFRPTQYLGLEGNFPFGQRRSWLLHLAFNIFVHVRWLTGHITNNFSHRIILHLKCLLAEVVAIYECRHDSFRSGRNNLQPPLGDPEKRTFAIYLTKIIFLCLVEKWGGNLQSSNLGEIKAPLSTNETLGVLGK